MQYRKLGSSGLKVSELSFGSWVTFHKQVDSKLAEQMFGLCLDAGVNFFDNAEGYERGMSEIVMGEALKKLSRPRDSYCVSSKVFFGAHDNPLPTQMGLSRKHVTEACHQALKRLQVDYLDLYFCHRADPDTPIEETVWAMHNLITQGKVLYWGTSEWAAHEIEAAYDFALENNLTLEEAALQNRIISKNITKSELKNILDPETYIGLAVKQAQLIIQDIENKRTK